MGNLMASFNTGVSGLQSAQLSLNTTAHNLANASTTGYTRQSAIITDFNYVNTVGSGGKLAQIGLGTDVVGIRQIRNTFLDAQYRLQLGRKSFYETQKQTLDELEDLFGEMARDEDYVDSFMGGITLFHNAINEIHKSPGDIAARDQLIALAGSLLEQAKNIKGQVDGLQLDLNVEISAKVDRVNELTAGITKWNQLIKRYEVRGEDANDYRDQRNLLLDELSKYVKFEAFEDKDGAINVHSEGNYLVSGDDSHELTTAKVGNATSMLKVIWADDGEDFIKFFGDISYSSENNTDIGSIRSIMVARGLKVANYLDLPVRPNIADYTDTTGVVDETAYKAAMTKFDQDTEIYNKQISPSSITKLQSELDLYMHEIATSINDILCPNKDVVDSNGNALKILDVENASIGDDFDKSVGIELFSRKGMSRYTLQEITLEGETEPIMAYVYNEEDSGNPDSLYSLAQLEVNPQLLRNPSMLPVKYNDQSGHREGYNSTIYENMLKAWDDAQLPMSPNDMTTYSFTDYYRAMVGEIGNQGHVWTASINQQTLVTAEAENNRQMVMGVSNEEELSDLVRFQHCYNASSRYITVVDDMLRHLIERL